MPKSCPAWQVVALAQVAREAVLCATAHTGGAAASATADSLGKRDILQIYQRSAPSVLVFRAQGPAQKVGGGGQHTERSNLNRPCVPILHGERNFWPGPSVKFQVRLGPLRQILAGSWTRQILRATRAPTIPPCRGHPLGPEAGIGGGRRTSMRIAVGDILERKLSTFWAVPFPYDGTRWASTPGAHG